MNCGCFERYLDSHPAKGASYGLVDVNAIKCDVCLIGAAFRLNMLALGGEDRPRKYRICFVSEIDLAVKTYHPFRTPITMLNSQRFHIERGISLRNFLGAVL